MSAAESYIQYEVFVKSLIGWLLLISSSPRRETVQLNLFAGVQVSNLVAVAPDAISRGVAGALAIDAGETLSSDCLAVSLPRVTVEGLTRLGDTTASGRVIRNIGTVSVARWGADAPVVAAVVANTAGVHVGNAAKGFEWSATAFFVTIGDAKYQQRLTQRLRRQQGR